VPVLRRFSKPLVALVALAVLALTLSACAFLKEGSLGVSQPGGIGAARVHFVLCSLDKEFNCGPNESQVFGENLQYLVGIAAPKGSSAPATFTAQPTTPGAQPIVFNRNDQVAAEMAASSAKLAATELGEKEGFRPWPPTGLEGFGYLSAPVQDQKGPAAEWSIDAEFGLPTAADGSPFTGPFATGLDMAAREVSPAHPADSPPKCADFEGEEFNPESGEAICLFTLEEAQAGTSDLKIAAPPTSPVYVGGKATLSFGLNFGSTAPTAPGFSLAATSTLPGATVALSSPTFTPPAVDSGTHRSSGSDTATVTVPSTTKPGVYEVTLTAKTAQGGTASQVAKIEVTKPKLKIGKVKLNKKNGTAKLSIGVPAAGTLTVSGKGIVKVQRKPTGPATVKVTIKAKGKAKKKLASTGKAKVKAKIVFKPSNGVSVTKTKSITLKKKLG
jgi:hypothetical protein